MPDSDATCRICRGEATPTQPLMHPCKCRGLIKYIHQDCLLEWLEHASSGAKKCDICATPYRFVTLYDPAMPLRMPAREICSRLVLLARDAVVKHVAAALYVVCVCQVPIYWKFMGRLCTYAVDGRMPVPGLSLFHVVAYSSAAKTRNGHSFASPEATVFELVQTFFFQTYLGGALQVLACVFVLFVVFIEHEWVVREEGYTKLLLRQVGREPKSKLVDLLSLIAAGTAEVASAEGANEEEDETNGARERMATLALEYIQHDAHAPLPDNPLREALENGQFDDLLRSRTEVAPREQTLNDPENLAANSSSHHPLEAPEDHSQAPALAGTTTELAYSGAESESDSDELSHNIEHVLPNEAQSRQRLAEEQFPEQGNPQRQPQPQLELHPREDLEETAEELERRRNIAEDDMAVAEAANNNANIFEVLGLRLQIATPIQLAFLVDLAALVLLFIFYFLPHMMGSFMALVFLYVLVGFHAVFLAPVLHFLPISRAYLQYNAITNLWLVSNSIVAPVSAAICQHFVYPLHKLLSEVFALDKATSPDYTARFVYLVIGYAVVCFAINQLMAALTFGRKPVTGTARRLYKILFQMTATAKVFVIFAIEIVFFPAYCGWLIDFCLTPLLVTNIVQSTESGSTYQIFLTSAYALTLKFIVRFFLYWMWGTAYMFCIALFVSMTRNHILRSGVLYFIKSPEDPNARLIHDAVVKPFFLQMLRILLSAKVYSAFIILGIGLVTWGLRLLVNAPGSEGAFLPIKQFSIFTWQFALITGMTIYKAEPVITKYCHMFWKRAFAVLCHKLRLSHFILGRLVPQERGHVVYKSIINSVLQIGTPDYTKPVSYSEAMEIFSKDSSVAACFVPDGSYIRAPSSDDNSRKFLRELFVPVTKSDQLLSPIKSADLEDDTDWWDAEVVCEDTYTVVYSPPNIRGRCLTLACMVSVFGALVFIVILLLATVIGRPIFRAWLMFTELNAAALGIELNYTKTTDWSFVDVNSLCVGLLAQLLCLLMLESDAEGSNLMNFAADQGRRLAEPAANLQGFLLRAGLFMAQKLLQVWFFAEMHFCYVPLLEREIFGTNLLSLDDEHIYFRFTWAGFIMHTFISALTVIPMFTTLSSGMPDMGSLQAWSQRVGLAPLVFGMVVILAHKGYEAVYGEFSPESAKYAHLAIVGTVLLIRGAMNARKLIQDVTEQIKTEKYVRGTAVQNVGGFED